MGSWHADETLKDGAYCGTTHCRAGWVVTLAGVAGKKMEDLLGIEVAALAIYHNSSDIHVNPAKFYEENKAALADIKRCAELEAKNVQA
jgi:hypothetical protein